VVLGYLPLQVQIGFIGDQYYRYSFVVFTHLLKEVGVPHFNISIGVLICYIVNDNAAVSSPIECLTQALKPLLSCSIPYLKQHILSIIQFHTLFYEIGADCRLLVQISWAFEVKRLDQRSFSDPRITYYDDLEETAALLAARAFPV